MCMLHSERGKGISQIGFKKKMVEAEASAYLHKADFLISKVIQIQMFSQGTNSILGCITVMHN